MLKRKESEQMQLELVTYDLLVRPDHLLRKIDAVIDFSFIHDLCAPLYCADNGRPAIDPEILFSHAVCWVSIWNPQRSAALRRDSG